MINYNPEPLINLPDNFSFSYFESFSWSPFAAFLVITGLFLILNAIYFIPSIIAFNKHHRNRWVIFALNFLLGMTGLVWILLLLWALDKFDDPIKRA